MANKNRLKHVICSPADGWRLKKTLPPSLCFISAPRTGTSIVSLLGNPASVQGKMEI